MFDKLFNIHLFEEEKIKNYQYLNHDEILSQFSAINFDEIYMDVEMIVTNNCIFSEMEINQNIHDSILFQFLKNTKEMFGINVIYSGHILKIILLTLLKNFSIKAIPFITMDNIRNYTTKYNEINRYAYDQLQMQKNYSMDIDHFGEIFRLAMTLLNLDMFENDNMINHTKRFYFHYFQTLLDSKSFSYINNPNAFKKRAEFTRQIPKVIYINFDVFKVLNDDVIYFIDNAIKNAGGIVVTKKTNDMFVELSKLVNSLPNFYDEKNLINFVDINDVIQRNNNSNDDFIGDENRVDEYKQPENYQDEQLENYTYENEENNYENHYDFNDENNQ